MAPTTRITAIVASKMGTLLRGPRFGMFGSALTGGLLAVLGHMKLRSILPPHTSARTLTTIPQPPSLNGAPSVGQPLRRAIRIAMFPRRAAAGVIPVAGHGASPGAAEYRHRAARHAASGTQDQDGGCRV